MDNKIKVSQLPECTDLTGLYTLGVDGNNSSVKVTSMAYTFYSAMGGTHNDLWNADLVEI